jgi:hypothetical protein
VHHLAAFSSSRSLNDTIYMITAAPSTSADPRKALLFAAGQAGV